MTSELARDAIAGFYPSNRTHLDLFSGIGGFALAAQSAGYQTIGFCEIEPYACKILKRHWPDVPNYGDIRNVRNVRADLITGGFPCQPYSLAGKRAGASDDRALWPEMCRVIAESRPTWVLGENVPGIITLELDRVLDDLERLGYAARPIVIPACAVDARHRRDRVWIVAHATRELLDGCGNERTRRRTEPANGCETLADSDETGRREQRRAAPMASQHAAAECGGEDEADARAGSDGAGGAAAWPTEPAVGRVADGIPNRTHRLKGLGNAIVPQVAETLIRMMARMENDKLRHSAPAENSDNTKNV